MRKIIIAVFLDFQRAFETITPELLLRKLYKLGIRGTAFQWFKSYLTDRTQVVKICEVISEELNNRFGVLQGSILGPILFILYINDLGDELRHSKIKLFADDTLLYVIADNVADAESQMNSDLSILFNKVCQNKLKLNVEKTKVMVITNKLINKNEVRIFINDNKLSIVSEMKYLGVIIE